MSTNPAKFKEKIAITQKIEWNSEKPLLIKVLKSSYYFIYFFYFMKINPRKRR
jgi:hypothetical protein